MSCFTTPQLTGAAAAYYFYGTIPQDGMTRTRTNRPPLAPLDPLTLRPQVPLEHQSPTTIPSYSVAECLFSPDSPESPESPESPLAFRSRRVPALIHRTPLAHHRALPLQQPTQCRSVEQNDIDEVMRFLRRVLRCMMHMYQVILVVATSIFHAMIATVQWVAVVAFVIEAMMLSAPSGDYGGGFIGPIVEQLTTATATSHTEITPSLHSRVSEAAALNFLSEQIDQAHNVLTLVEGLGDDAFFAYHYDNVQRFLSRSRGDPPSGGSKTEVDLTVDFRGLDTTLVQTLSPYGFIGRTISHALDEVTYHSKRIQTPFLIRSAVRESRLDSVYSLASSNLLLEYSSILSKTESIIPNVVALHHQLSRNLPEVLANTQSRQAAASRRSIWGIFASQRLNPKAVEEESLEAFVAGLETVLVNLRHLNAYLEWITDQLIQRTLLSSTSMVSSSSYTSCSSALRDLLDRASSVSKKSSRCCRCPDSGKDTPTAPARVEFNIPGSRTLLTVS